MDLGPHAAFIIASYVSVTVIIGALIAWLIFDGLQQRHLLNELHARGTRRRSAKVKPDEVQGP